MITELIPGKVYNLQNGAYIGIVDGNHSQFITPKSNTYYENRSKLHSIDYRNNNSFKLSQYRKATSEEEQWFRICQKENKFIPLEEARKLMTPLSTEMYPIY